MLGLSGVHGTGKTTLAKAYADKRDFTFLASSATPTFERLGLSPSARLSFAERLMVQVEVLNDLDKGWATSSGSDVITDRTPLDLMMYVMADVGIGSVTTAGDIDNLKRYIDRCFDVANKRFSTIVVIQPGIEIVHGREGKGASEEMYIEHCNMVLLGMLRDPRLETPSYYVRRQATEIETRVSTLDSCIGRVLNAVIADKAGATLH